LSAPKSYAAVGDSVTEGIGEPGEVAWPIQVAKALDIDEGPRIYARYGAVSSEVEAEQLGPAIAGEPELMTLVCGANDVILNVRPDLDAYAERISRMFARVRENLPGTLLATATYPAPEFFDLRQRTLSRVLSGLVQVNVACRAAAAEHDVLLLDWEGHPGALERENFASDGFHPSPAGHRMAAREFIAAISERLSLDLVPETTESV
jgi:lysophospholipase L1-like esterase